MDNYYMREIESKQVNDRSKPRRVWVAGPIIAGAGPSGLAAAACLKERGVPNLVVERANCIASLWQLKTYDRLKLHLPKHFCELPLMPFPSNFPTYPTKQQFVEYLHAYALRFDIKPVFDRSVESARFDHRSGLWSVRTEATEAAEAVEYLSQWLVVATGENAEQVVPEIPGIRDFSGEIMHTSEYKSGEVFRGKRVLVVGCGNSGMEVCLDLCNYNARPSLVVRDSRPSSSQGTEAISPDSKHLEASDELDLDVCPQAEAIIFSWVEKAVAEDPRMAASLLRLHFHDCFVNGCDASVLLDDTEGFIGEKTALPNVNSLRGFEVIDAIKSELEAFCPETVSCADILAIAARDSVVVSGGPSWEVPMGRKDSLIASKTEANNNIPSPNSTVSLLLSKFQSVGLDIKYLVALSGAHTIGKARCSSFSARLIPQDFTPPEFIESLRELCIYDSNTAASLDTVTPKTFDNQYFINLLSGEGLLPSDQTLTSGESQTARDIAITYAEDTYVFFADFATSMVKMGNIASSSYASPGEIRRQCRLVNHY